MVLQGLVIYVNDGLLANQIVIPLPHALNQGIQLFVVCWIAPNILGECLLMVKYKIPIFHQYCSHGISTGISLNLERLLDIW